MRKWKSLFSGKQSGHRKTIITVLMAIVVFTTTYSLILPAITLSKDRQELTCLFVVHQHTEDCYVEEPVYDDQGNQTGTNKVLVCGRADYVGHQHDESCYQDDKLVCQLPEIKAHVHDKDCFKTEKILSCGLEETDGHRHTDRCYTEDRTLTCTKPEHTHTDACYSDVVVSTEEQLICGYDEGEEISPAVWSDPEYSEAVVDPETGEVLEEAQLIRDAEIIQEAVIHHHDDSCYKTIENTERQLTCGMEEHTHDDSCYHVDRKLTCGLAEGESHRHSASCYTEQDVLTCTEYQELHTHTMDCYEKGPKGESPEKMGWARYEEDENGNKIVVGDYTHRICSKTELFEHQHDQKCFSVNTLIEEKPVPLAALETEDNDTLTETETNAEGITFDTAIPVEGADYSLKVTGDAACGIPKDAVFKASAIKEDASAYDEFASMAQEAAAEEKEDLNSEDCKTLALFDLSIYDAEGSEIQPSAPLTVQIVLDNASADAADEASDLYAVHFKGTSLSEDGDIIDKVTEEKVSADDVVTEVINAENADGGVSFDAGSFSVYAVVYTVDFHWEVDGKTYDFSIPGGGFVSFYNLVEVLGIEVNDSNTEKDEIQELVDGIESITFSSPELVSVSKVEENTTVGAIKELLNLECEYSAELTEEKIVEINAQEVKAGDWALIALHSFTSEETLMVSMRNGDKFVVRVTDAVFGAFPQDVKIDIVGNGGIELTEYYSDPYSVWDDEERVKTYFSARTVPMSLSYFAYDWTNNVAANNGAIIARAGQGYVFDHWEKNGQRLTGSQFSTDTIAERTLYFSSISSDTLTAVFRKTNNGGGGGNISIDDIIAQWSTDITNDQPKVDKTASVYDYDDRIYQIDITASSELYAINRDLDIDFVTDVSRSMLFPSKLDKAASVSNANDLLGKLDAVAAQNHNGSIPNRTAQGEYYYLIIKPQTASDVYICRKVNGKWYRNAAANVAYFNDADSTITGLNNGWREIKAHEVNDGTGNIYLDKLTSEYIVDKYIYVATDDTQRIEYLKRALNIVKDVLYKVDPDARIGLTTFAKTANQGQFYTNSQQDQNALANAITNITLDDNTDQAAGLAAGKNLLDSDTSNNRKKVMILITDGAPNAPSTSPYAPLTWDKIQGVAQTIKNDGIDIYTVGLSLENVQGASEGLYYTSSNSEEGKVGYAFDAKDGIGLVEAVESIIDSIIVKASMTGSVSDTIDPAFYPVDKEGNPLQAGVEYEDEQGHKYTLTQSGDTWTVNWIDQEFKWQYTDEDNVTQPGWKGTVYVKAKENFLGGNKIKTNSGTGNDKVTATGYKTILGHDEYDNEIPGKYGPLKNQDGTPKTVTKTLATPHVNVDELQLTEEQTTWTVYIDSTVDPMTQLKNLYKNIDVSEVVTETGTDYRRTAEGALNSDHDRDSERFPLTNITGELTDANWNTLLSGNPITITYGTGNEADKTYAYGHQNVGEIQISLSKTYASGENMIANSSETGHTANKEGEKVEQYTLTVKYVPNSAGAATTYDHVPEGRAGDLTGEMTSINKHDITVIQKGIKITKVDKKNNNQTLTGATFALYREDPAGTADVSDYKLPSGKNYTLVSDTLTVNSNGMVTIDPLIPDKENVSGKTVYQPDNTIGAEAAAHDTVYYLVEKTPPTDYNVMPGAIKFTFALSELKTDQITERTAVYHGAEYKKNLVLYNWTQGAAVTGAEEVSNGSETQYLITDGETNNLYAYRIKNGKPTDITLIKVDKSSGESIGGAKFCLIKGSEGVDLTELTITSITDNSTVTPEDYDYNDTTIKVVTVPEGGIRISGLADGTYTLREVVSPDGYIITDNEKMFITESGTVNNTDGTAHNNEAQDITFKVENEPGAALPNTGGPGTRLYTILGSVLATCAGLLLLRRKRII